MNTRSARIRRHDLASRRAGEEVVVLDLASATYHGLNPSGALLWEALGDWKTDEELAAVLVRTFGLTSDAAAGDVERFLDTCAGAGLVEVRSDP
jgi:hypothetical protein